VPASHRGHPWCRCLDLPLAGQERQAPKAP
jgi:hypothetical protein